MKPNAEQLVDFTAEWTDFTDSAAMIDNLDVIVSIDSAVIHLAAALNKPTWSSSRPIPIGAGSWSALTARGTRA